MKHTKQFAGLMLLGLMMTMNSCKNEKTPQAYIGPSEIQVQDGTMTPEVLLSLGRLSDPQLSPDGSKILYGVSYTSIAENRSCRNLFICNPDGTGKVQLTQEGKSINAARWSKDGKTIFFIQGGQLYKAAFKGDKLGKKVKLSDVAEGVSDYKISPDETHVYYVSTIPGPVKGPQDFDQKLDKAQAYVATDLMYRHWDHWVTETPRTYVAELGSEKITKANSVDILGTTDPGYELPTEPFGGAEQLDWSSDSRYIVYSCRKHVGKQYAFSTNTGLYIYDTKTGETVTLAGNGGYDTDPVWSPDGSQIAWISMERDGYEADRQRLMVADVTLEPLSIGNVRELTKDFVFDASGIVYTPDSRKIIFASTINAVGALCSVDAKAEGAEIKRMTKEDWMYSFGSPFAVLPSENGCKLLATYMSMELPTELVSLDVTGDEATAYTQISDENGHILSQLGEVRVESRWIKANSGEDLHFWVMYPPKFNPNMQYPVIEMFNGGPQTSIDQSWSYRWNFFLMAQQGYIVILPNRHGDSGFGQPWKEQISGDYQGLNMDDYISAGKWAKDQPWCGKMAGVGASYGGFSVYNMMGIHGDLFDCFIAHAGIFNEKQMWYTTEESWFCNWDNGGLQEFAFEPGKVGPAGDGVTFGGLQQAGAPYADVAKTQYHYDNDPETRVTKWHTPILCIHGMLDFRIPYEQGMAAFAAAQLMGVPSKLVIFPEECHWILQPQNSMFWHEQFYSWLEEWIK